MPKLISGIPTPEYDTLLAEKGGHFLQSGHWARVQQRLGREIFWGQTESWSLLAIRHSGPVGLNYLYAPYGPVAHDQPKRALEALNESGRRQKALFVRLEPTGRADTGALKAAGAKPVDDQQPHLTSVLDLRKTESELWSGLASGRRNSINTARKRGITFREQSSEDSSKLFWDMLRDTAENAGFKTHPRSYYEAMFAELLPAGAASFFVAEKDNQPLASVLCFDFAGVRYYAHAASYWEQNRQLNASGPLLWHTVTDARSKGAHTYDFWGVSPKDSPNHPWAGFSAFKRSFGGQDLERVGTWEIPVNRPAYKVYEAMRKLRR